MWNFKQKVQRIRPINNRDTSNDITQHFYQHLANHLVYIGCKFHKGFKMRSEEIPE